MKPSQQQFELLLTELCRKLSKECRQKGVFASSKSFETRVRELFNDDLLIHGLAVDFSPHPYGFPDIALRHCGVEVKFNANYIWRSVANSVFESS